MEDDPYMPKFVTHVAGVYGIMNIVNGDWYVGSSKNMRKRGHDHRSNLRRGKHENRLLQNAWKKYGEDNFKFFVVELCDAGIRVETEQFWLTRLNPELNILKVAHSPGDGRRVIFSRTHRNNLSKSLKNRTVGNALLEKNKTHCPSGHMYDPGNTYVQVSQGRKGRVCRTCKRVRDRARYQRNHSNV